MINLFWISVFLVLYIYIGYPVLIRFLASRRSSKVFEAKELPKLTILTAAFNEAQHIEATIRNKFELDYPAELLEMIVISDESDDGTDEIIESLIAEAPFPLRLIRQTPRKGKTSGLNIAIPEATGQILIFSDANSMFHVDALKHLVSSFDNPEVGYVTGKMIYTEADGSIAGDGCSAYMRYENQLREWESACGSIVGVDGGIDAMRKILHSQLNADQLPDFVQPLKVIEKGFKVKYQPNAILHEDALNDSEREYKMRVRVGLRALWAMWDMRQLFNPLFYGFFSVQLISHKLLRYFAFIPLVLALISNLFLLGSGGIYQLALFAQLGLYGLAVAVWMNPALNNKTWAKISYYFVLINWASAHASILFLTGKKIVLWKPREG